MLSIPRLVIDLPEPPVESIDDVTGELSQLIEHERPRRTTSQPPPIPRPTSVPLIGDWHVGFELGRGGMSTVHAVSHREFGKRAALKLSHSTIDGPSIGAKLFLREARVVQLIDHPAIPDVFATGTHDDRPYLVMERLHGENLAELVERGGVDRKRAIEILLELCDVVAVAHEAGVVHRDLKLDNVFVLAEPTSRTRIKLLDWGFARVAGEADPFQGMVAGTLSYVAPEQVLGDPITTATDIYSLGVVMYRLLLGQAAFTSASDVDLARLHLRTPPAHPSLLWREIPKPLAALLIAMLAREPLCRPSLAEVRSALQSTHGRRRLFSLKPSRVPAHVLRRVFGAATAIVSAIAGAAAML